MLRLARRLAAVFAVAFVLVATSLLGGSTASAATPVVVGSCATTVEGAPGTPVQLQPAAVLEPVVNVVRALDPLNLVTPTVRSVLSALPPIPIGAIPTGSGFITAGQIANAVNAQLAKIPLLGPLLSAVSSGVQKAFSGMCGVTVKAANTVGAAAQDGTSRMADAANDAAHQAGIGPGSAVTNPGKTGGGTPARRASPAPVAAPAVAARPAVGSRRLTRTCSTRAASWACRARRCCPDGRGRAPAGRR
ncbi:hypothetical protein GCM10029964_122480 [Kibdelosporangium lantanae]